MPLGHCQGIRHQPATIGTWRRRYPDHGIEGLHDKQRPGRPHTYDDQRVAQVLNRALQGGPPNATHGNIPMLSQHNGVSKSTIHWWFQLFNRSPHRQRHFKISNNPYCVDKLQDIVGLQSEATGSCRCPLLLPLGLDHGKGVTHDSICHGATTLFAALAVATGNVLVRGASTAAIGARKPSPSCKTLLTGVCPKSGYPSEHHQLLHPQTPHGEGVAGGAAQVPPAFHFHRCPMDQSGRPTRIVSQCLRTHPEG